MLGRNKDKKTLYDVGPIGKDQQPTVPEPSTLSEKQWADKFKGLKLEYVDKDGRKLTTKEEFRRLSYKFHGYGHRAERGERRRGLLMEL